ncbi:MAPEG family protein [Bradyrhizobium sp. HKCCYLRH1073]|uniref:MAPEG family protein n=1 Tax=unclassified Bradyrhizobium TaxID=2631580 RepID=UPI0028E4048B|nr:MULTISPECIES: MAPEG family protein [unclassified Bradyrhizobium]
MSLTMVLLPVFVQVGLTFALLFWNRTRAQTADVADEFGLPTLFYALIAIALPLRHADLVIVLLSWVFVVTRFVNAGLVSGAKDSRQRGLAWTASALVLLAMWLYFALKILLLI